MMVSTCLPGLSAVVRSYSCGVEILLLEAICFPSMYTVEGLVRSIQSMIRFFFQFSGMSTYRLYHALPTYENRRDRCPVCRVSVRAFPLRLVSVVPGSRISSVSRDVWVTVPFGSSENIHVPCRSIISVLCCANDRKGQSDRMRKQIVFFISSCFYRALISLISRSACPHLSIMNKT